MPKYPHDRQFVYLHGDAELATAFNPNLTHTLLSRFRTLYPSLSYFFQGVKAL